ncbi:MAG: PAS domain S-box protein [Phycisphaerae bacterium]|nr:PAS domain S-box protein [Phycisphaerae bacterium]
MFFARKGFVFSVILSFVYLLLILHFTKDSAIILQALARVFVFVIIAQIITSLSTKRKRIEEKLLHTSVQLKSVINSSSQVSIIATDLTGRIVTFNSGAEHMLGYSAQEMVDKTPVVIHLKSEVAERGRELTKELGYPVEGFEVFVAYAKKGKYEEREWTYIRKDGSRLIVNLVVTPVQNDAGQMIGFLGVANDITKRIKSERAALNLLEDLQEAKAFLETSIASFHNIVAKSIDGIVIVDKTGTVQFTNTAAETFLGNGGEKLIGQIFRFPINTGQITEIDIIRDNKEPGVAEMRVVETKWNNNPAWLALLRDITERKKTEEKLKKSMEVKSEFTSMVSHELRTPLTAIKEGIALVFDGLAGEVNEEQKELLGISKKNVDRLTRLINEVLDLQKLDSGMMKFNLEANDINKVVKDVYKTMVSLANNAGLDFLLELDNNLPNCSFDSDKITQVLANLVTNAMKFTKRGNITIKTSQYSDSIRVSVSDTGCGIKKEDMSKIFNRFEQLGLGGERKTGGTGLGLAISREIIERHNGTIWLESAFGKGSTFTFTLPVCNTEELLKKYINNGIKKASKNNTKMSLVLVSFAGFDKLKQEFSNNEMDFTLKDMEAILESNLHQADNRPPRTVDNVFKLHNEIFVVLANCDKENTLKVKSRLEQVLDNYLADKNLADKIKMLWGFAVYPDDAATDENLVRKARELQLTIPSGVSV